MSRLGFCQRPHHHLARRAGSSASSADLAASSLGLQPSSARAEVPLARAVRGSRGRALARRRRALRATRLHYTGSLRLLGRLRRCARRPGRSCGGRGATRRSAYVETGPMWPASAAQAADRAGQCYPSGRLNETVRGSRQPGARSAAERGLRSATQLARGSEPPCSPTYRLIGEKLKPASMLALPCLTCVPLQVPGRTLSHRAATARAALPAPPPTRVPRGGVLSGCVAVLWARTGRRRARRSLRTPSACPRRMAAGDRGPSAAARRT
jgi:hypothetical protein